MLIEHNVQGSTRLKYGPGGLCYIVYHEGLVSYCLFPVELDTVLIV